MLPPHPNSMPPRETTTATTTLHCPLCANDVPRQDFRTHVGSCGADKPLTTHQAYGQTQSSTPAPPRKAPYMAQEWSTPVNRGAKMTWVGDGWRQESNTEEPPPKKQKVLRSPASTWSKIPKQQKETYRYCTKSILPGKSVACRYPGGGCPYLHTLEEAKLSHTLFEGTRAQVCQFRGNCKFWANEMCLYQHFTTPQKQSEHP
eukprot:Lithocolla_globosa_v1_NODE_132_length_5923_cov_39.615883.p6 type:complete len:203 gc:universal NODE_132_length_5923_cov_39.615883:3335-2727(-)